MFQDVNYTSQPTVYKILQMPPSCTAKVSSFAAEGPRDLLSIEDTENCEVEADVCYLSNVKAYILVALLFTR